MNRRSLRGGATAAVSLVAVLAGCVTVPPGIRTVRAEETDRVAVRAPPPGWKRLAVLSFGGDPAHRRPAEELVALGISRAVPIAVIGPFSMRRWCRAYRADLDLPEAAGRWSVAYVEPDEAEPPRDELRALARAAAVDALVLGHVAPGGAAADLVLVEGSTGEPIAAVRRAGSARAAERGVHELAMSSTAAVLADLVEVLRTSPGKRPRVPEARPAEEGP